MIIIMIIIIIFPLLPSRGSRRRSSVENKLCLLRPNSNY